MKDTITCTKKQHNEERINNTITYTNSQGTVQPAQLNRGKHHNSVQPAQLNRGKHQNLHIRTERKA
jgi:hypothetical protein